MDYEKDYEDLNENYDYYNENDYKDYTNEYKYDYDDPSYQEPKKHKNINDIFQDEEEEFEIDDTDDKLMKSMDNDLAGYFSDARLFAPKKKMVDTMKKKPKRIFYKAGANVSVTINRQSMKATVLFGPYESNKKQVYQLELENGELAEIDEKKIKQE